MCGIYRGVVTTRGIAGRQIHLWGWCREGPHRAPVVGPKGGTNLAPHRGPDTTPTDGLNSNSTGSHNAPVDAAHPLSSHPFVSKIR